MNPDELRKLAEEEAKELLLYFVCPKNRCTIKKTCFDCAVIGEKISRRILSFHSKHQEEWKKELQRLTPGGSEFTEPKECGDYLRRMKDQKHEAMLKLKHQDERVKRLERALLGMVRTHGEPCPHPELCSGYKEAKQVLEGANLSSPATLGDYQEIKRIMHRWDNDADYRVHDLLQDLRTALLKKVGV